jgi:hypothetical protein
MRFYISTTYVDLTEHRKAAINALGEFFASQKERWVDYEYVDAERFSVAGTPQLADCLRAVSESDYFVLILAWRYGYIPEGSEKSIVELEYDTAVEKSLPRFCFLIDDAFPVPPKFVEAGEGAKRLQYFKQRVQQENMVVRFSTPADLARELTLSISVLDRPLSEATQALIEHSALFREYRRCRDEEKMLRDTVESYKEKLARIVPADPIWRGRSFDTDNSLGFVLMPFQDMFFLIYEEAILPALQAAGLRGLHAGEIFGNREIMEDIWQAICSAKFVIADVTGRNPNVFYELGIAHTLGKECIVLTQNRADAPFDIAARRYLDYDPAKLTSLRSRLEKTIKTTLVR